MGVALIGWGRFIAPDGSRVTVPAPTTEPAAPWLFDFLAGAMRQLRDAGFSALQLPPVSKSEGGAGAGCDGYGVFDRRDIGSKDAQGSRPTRYGDADALRRCIAVAHGCGLDVYHDIVLHQLMGENGGPGVFRYAGADGVPGAGRGAMDPGCFRGVPPADRAEDAVPAPADDFEFGRELVYQNCDPPGYTEADAIDFGDWLFRTTDADGARFDDTKGTWAPFVARFMRAGAMAGKLFYSEYFDGNPATLDWWATSAPMFSRSLVADFTLHWALQAACNGGTAWPLAGAGYLAKSPFLACTFVDNPDTDTSPGEQVIGNKLLAYAFLLTSEGYPFVYGKDYFSSAVWPGAYGLQPFIDNLVWIHEKLAAGPTVVRHLDASVLVQERTGAPGLLAALNFDTWNAREITCDTAFGPWVALHDYTGRHADIRTDGAGRATFTVPSNAWSGGQSYLCFSRVGAGGAVERTGRATTQVFFGAPDLDTAPATAGRRVPAGCVWCARGTRIDADLALHSGGMRARDVRVVLLGPDGALLASAPGAVRVAAATTGWHALHVEAVPDAGARTNWELTVTYHAGVEVSDEADQ